MNRAAFTQIATAFLDARRSGAVLRDYPGERPEDLFTAYAIQDCGIALVDSQVVGWKVGRINPPRSDSLQADRLAGPIFAGTVQSADDAGDTPHMPVCPGGFAAVEAEFLLRLAGDDLDKIPADDTATLAIVDQIRIGIEVASSPYPAINDDGPCVTVSDRGNNAGLVLGTHVPREFWSALNEVSVSLAIDGAPVGKGSTATMLDGPLGAVRFLLANLKSRGIVARPGQWISTGAITGIHEIAPGQKALATFAGIGTVGTVAV